eukprot:s884_g39.t1
MAHDVAHNADDHVSTSGPDQGTKLALVAQIKIADNILQHPGEMRYRTIWKQNPVFQEAMVQSGHEQEMRKLFFEERGEVWVFNEKHLASLKVLIADLRQSLRVLQAENTFSIRERGDLGLEKRGFQVTRYNTYTTRPVEQQSPKAVALMEKAQIVTFGSPSAVRAWGQATTHRPLAACIGQTSHDAAQAAGFERIYSPEKSSCPVVQDDTETTTPGSAVSIHFSDKIQNLTLEGEQGRVAVQLNARVSIWRIVAVATCERSIDCLQMVR